MVTDEQLALLRQIDNAIAYDDETGLTDLVVEGYVEKDGDLFQLTPKGEKCLLDNGAGMIIS